MFTVSCIVGFHGFILYVFAPVMTIDKTVYVCRLNCFISYCYELVEL